MMKRFFVFLIGFTIVFHNVAFAGFGCRDITLLDQNHQYIPANDSVTGARIDLFLNLLGTNPGSVETATLHSEIYSFIENGIIADSLQLSFACYLSGYFFQRQGYNDNAILNYEKSKLIRENLGETDDRTYSICLANLSSLYRVKGDIQKSHDLILTALAIREKISGINSTDIIQPLSALAASYINMNDKENAITTARRGIEIAEHNNFLSAHVVNLYINAGIASNDMRDLENARLYFNVAREKYNAINSSNINSIIIINNGLAVVYGLLEDNEMAEARYREVIEIIRKNNYSERYGLAVFSNYAFLLERLDRLDEAEYYMREAVAYARSNFGDMSREHVTETENLAYFMTNVLDKPDEAIDLYESFDRYIESNRWDISLVSTIKSGWGEALVKKGDLDGAFILYNEVISDTIGSSGIKMINNLIIRHTILYKLYLRDSEPDYLLRAFADLERAIELIDNWRLDLSAEDSRLFVGGRFEYIFDDCINILVRLFDETGDRKYLKLAFKYSEKGKAAALLAATRETKAMKFHIPDDLTWLESDLNKKINRYTEVIYNERSAREPDDRLIVKYEHLKLKSVIKRDSLLHIFENRFPRYYTLKNTGNIADIDQLQDYLDRKDNFVEYYMSDTLLFTFLINRNDYRVFTSAIDSGMREDISAFREDLINPQIGSGARSQFNRYSERGYDLYRLLLEPVIPYLTSNRLIVAPDDMLAYIPFEALLSDTAGIEPLNYRTLPYIVNDFNLKYAYSGTLLLEIEGKGRSFYNPGVVFAPDYSGSLSADSLLLARQSDRGLLVNIPGAREEAIYVNSVLGGEIYLDEEATESRFVKNAADGRVIHLAMHTLLDDRDPMYSMMVFALNSDYEDGLLKTYEVYDIPLEASMVVLSSCNTGTGHLQSGEGVISLARGFLYSGSPSVIMSLWEVDDRSGSKIVKSFYDYLKRGVTKSTALRKARKDYLKDSDQLRSHPYFWCTLVILGEDEPIYYPLRIWSIAAALLIILLLIYKYRDYIFKSS